MAKIYIFIFFFSAVLTGMSQENKLKETGEDPDMIPVFDYQTRIRKTFPTIKAKIGTKQGVTLDQRYFIYSKYQKDDGTVKYIKMGTVRASNYIGDNTSDSTEYTQFYQISGTGLSNKMYIKKAEDKGFGFSMALCMPTSHQTEIKAEDIYGNELIIEQNADEIMYMKLDYNISPLVSKLLKKPFFTEVRICAGVAIVAFKHNKQASIYWNDQTNQAEETGGTNYLYGQKNKNYFYKFFGISKDIHLRKNIKISPFIQYFFGVENYTSLGFNGNITIYRNFSYYMGFHWFYGYRPDPKSYTNSTERLYFSKMYTDLIGFRFYL